jgi:hypothetical protein
MASYDANAIRLLIETALAAHDGSCLDEPHERKEVAETLVEVVIEYLRPHLISQETKDQTAG